MFLGFLGFVGNTLTGMGSLLHGISVDITQLVYPLIPRLYKIYLYFSTFQFLSNDFIENTWNNLYSLVGVIVLFSIAIKLISAMVNPDTITDNKKGAKGTYMRAIISVILIFVSPLLFNMSFKVQQDLVEDNFLLKHVLGINIDGDIGQILAWETFSSFCAPVDKNGQIIPYDETDNDLVEYYAIQADIDYINDLGSELAYTVAIGTWSSIEYHAILCPLSGILVAYEMVLLCMDIIFRSAKLALLELMIPLVLGAYVFNQDILKGWAKEFFSTYIILFLKILAIGFMVIAIIELKAVIL